MFLFPVIIFKNTSVIDKANRPWMATHAVWQQVAHVRTAADLRDFVDGLRSHRGHNPEFALAAYRIVDAMGDTVGHAEMCRVLYPGYGSDRVVWRRRGDGLPYGMTVPFTGKRGGTRYFRHPRHVGLSVANDDFRAACQEARIAYGVTIRGRAYEAPNCRDDLINRGSRTWKRYRRTRWA